MVWPIPILPTSWVNASPQVDSHPNAHNALADGVNTIAARFPRGFVAQAIGGTVTGAGVPEIDVSGMSVTWTTTSGRKYLALAQFHLTKHGGLGNGFPALTNAANALLVGVTYTFAASADSYASPIMFYIVDGSGLAVTLKGRVHADSGTVDVRKGDLVVIDLGTSSPLTALLATIGGV